MTKQRDKDKWVAAAHARLRMDLQIWVMEEEFSKMYSKRNMIWLSDRYEWLQERGKPYVYIEERLNF